MGSETEDLLKAAIAKRDAEIRRDERHRIARSFRKGLTDAPEARNEAVAKVIREIAEILER